jgi:hypothetical protein
MWFIINLILILAQTSSATRPLKTSIFLWPSTIIQLDSAIWKNCSYLATNDSLDMKSSIRHLQCSWLYGSHSRFVPFESKKFSWTLYLLIKYSAIIVLHYTMASYGCGWAAVSCLFGASLIVYDSIVFILVWKGNLMVRSLIMVQAGYLKLINNDPLIWPITPLLFLRPHRRFSILLQTLRYLCTCHGCIRVHKTYTKTRTLCFFLGHSLNLMVHIFIQHSLIVIVAIIMCFQFRY